MFGKIGTLTRRKKSLTSHDDAANHPQEVDYDEVEADLVEKEGREAIDLSLLLPQPDLKNLEDGILLSLYLKVLNYLKDIKFVC